VNRKQQVEVDCVICGNCLEVLQSFPDNSIDAVVTDPPYGLNEIKDLPGLLRAWLEGEDGSKWQTKGFMGKGWDKVPPPSVWREVFRVMKPGAYILCFAGCRTVDLMGISLRLAGFEDNNLLAWLQGQGFPKVTDVGKMIDKVNGYSLLDVKRWDGWKYGKQALKPAMEPVLLMQKPFEKGLAGYQNVLKWGTGALNIEACRIPLHEGDVCRPMKAQTGGNRVYKQAGRYEATLELKPNGRFPANVLLDEVAAQALDKQSGESTSHGGGKASFGGIFGNKKPVTDVGAMQRFAGDHGGASRFFYVAKASTRERNAGLDGRNLHPTVKPIELMRYLVRLITPPNGVVLDPFCGTGTTCIAAMLEGFHYVGIDFEPKYCEWAEQRIKWYWAHPEKTKKRSGRDGVVEMSLFGVGAETEKRKCWSG